MWIHKWRQLCPSSNQRDESNIAQRFALKSTLRNSLLAGVLAPTAPTSIRWGFWKIIIITIWFYILTIIYKMGISKNYILNYIFRCNIWKVKYQNKNSSNRLMGLLNLKNINLNLYFHIDILKVTGDSLSGYYWLGSNRYAINLFSICYLPLNSNSQLAIN